MKILASAQNAPIADAVRSKFAMVAPVLEATLYSLKLDRVERLGGYNSISLYDLAREVREGSGDAGICFEYAVHEGIAKRHPLIFDRASEVLEQFCKIPGGAESLLFGPEKDGRIPILQSVQDALTPESRLYVGSKGQPPKLKTYLPHVMEAFRRQEARDRLPASISGLWKADLFIGNAAQESWVGVTVKIQGTHLEGAKGLRIGVYPQVNAKDTPRFDDTLNLIRLPLPYDGAFMELYWKSFFLVRAFLRADARVPDPDRLPDAEDRYVTQELETRRESVVTTVIDVLREMGQDDLLGAATVTEVSAQATLTDQGVAAPSNDASQIVSLAPVSFETETA